MSKSRVITALLLISLFILIVALAQSCRETVTESSDTVERSDAAVLLVEAAPAPPGPDQTAAL